MDFLQIFPIYFNGKISNLPFIVIDFAVVMLRVNSKIRNCGFTCRNADLQHFLPCKSALKVKFFYYRMNLLRGTGYSSVPY